MADTTIVKYGLKMTECIVGYLVDIVAIGGSKNKNGISIFKIK